MKVKVKKLLSDLLPSEIKKIEEYYDEELFNARNKDIVIQQKKWLKLACILLHDKMHMTAEECTLFLANWREIYRINSELSNAKEQEEYLQENIDRIFNGNYPEIFIEKLERI